MRQGQRETPIMSRPKKKPDYDAGKVMTEFLNAIAEAFGAPYDDRSREPGDGSPGLNRVAKEFGITALKARKLLITANVYSTETARKIQQFRGEGKSLEEIQELMHLSRASVHSYLPYQKSVYKLGELSCNAERTELYRKRQQALKSLMQCKAAWDSFDAPLGSLCDPLDDALWNALILFQNYPFCTAKKLEFTYTIKGNEIFVDRKEKSITKSTVMIAFHKALELGAEATGPKKLGTFGASYLYPIFVRFGILS